MRSATEECEEVSARKNASGNEESERTGEFDPSDVKGGSEEAVDEREFPAPQREVAAPVAESVEAGVPLEISECQLEVGKHPLTPSAPGWGYCVGEVVPVLGGKFDWLVALEMDGAGLLELCRVGVEIDETGAGVAMGGTVACSGCSRDTGAVEGHDGEVYVGRSVTLESTENVECDRESGGLDGKKACSLEERPIEEEPIDSSTVE